MYLSVSADLLAADGKLIGTAGLIQVEGSGGGGIVPWATIAGYDSRDQISVNVAISQVDIDDYRLNTLAASVSFYDRLEMSVAHQRFDLKTLGGDIRQNVVGLKYRVYGDVVFSAWPQVSVGMQHKRLEDGAIAEALGADSYSSGTDFYVAMTKVHLAALAGYNAVWNLTARATRANEMGLLGFGSTTQNGHEVMLEASAGILFSRHLAVGVEYRQKPDNLGLGEDDWFDVFVSYIPNKNINLTLAWVQLGSIAGAQDQSGLYLSVNGQLW
ncbi:DUF3034 family protein [Aliiglaciecola sp. LCG003]|uniref:DUF3034 family protein n=1 Tax=Aliiglaciecola sp. LCG003 TaxID=3053655 RepID=UPI0025733F1D|nr:DUF3034 family protein [Aliiglaciecola sp. LCG003]WJG11343.1 DUF3034 family protein [Aliiglaciecola sp. LCG003]